MLEVMLPASRAREHRQMSRRLVSKLGIRRHMIGSEAQLGFCHPGRKCDYGTAEAAHEGVNYWTNKWPLFLAGGSAQREPEEDFLFRHWPSNLCRNLAREFGEISSTGKLLHDLPQEFVAGEAGEQLF